MAKKMPPTSTQTTSASIPANLAAILQAYGLPMPTGTNENAEPFWVINNQKISWAQMQTIIWQRQMAVAQARGTTKSGGPESMSMPNVVDANLDGVPDVKFEQKIEGGVEQQKQMIDSAIEAVKEQDPKSDAPVAQQTAKVQSKQDSYLGDSPVLSAVDTSDVSSMTSFATANAAAPENTSKRFLAETLKKLLLMLSLKM